MSQPQAQIKRMLLALLACTVSSTMLGCAYLFREDSTAAITTHAAVPMQRDTIRLDVAIADRPAADLLLKLLWDDVDEIGVLDVDRKRALNSNGFRAGVAGSAVPSALQTILAEAAAEISAIGQIPIGNTQSDLPGSSQVTLFNGQDTLFAVSDSAVDELRFVGAGEDPNAEPRQFLNAKCVIRLTAEKMQDGWVKVRLLPEIHHGANADRPVVADGALQYRKTQMVEPLYEYQFDITLNPGELAVIGTADASEDCLGRQFLEVSTPSGKRRKLITIRFLGTSTVQAQRSPDQL